ncbi:TBPIP-domain-containing protein [Basidiobolus meristosporus CBS 931.73]|uniref:Homologous-pairing protein 2 homolog n=1 Tax=Basidiobolus meristosporus CBS 931.73 TaxID=1314790 RepID=A0A1Y1XIV4_9FUNG|nr:TBPIP-domain-containing protein [Basidiobolus meristosporus CBS 931.73]|eukprot:ORX85690.1 TBPIP-domain-containing protein [Basidiobolus meristosporus CBS 931.73]
MAPVKKKAKTEKVDNAEEAVLEYLRRNNRPYSATDIFNNLHGAVGKTAVQKILTQLVEKEEITGKAYGKQWVYCISQDKFETPSQEELDEMDKQIEALWQQVAQKKEENKQLASVFSGLNNSLTNSEIEERLGILEAENQKYEERLARLREGGKQISLEDKKKIDTEFENNRKLWRARKRMFNDIFNTITEFMPGKPKDLLEEQGIETDADAGVDINADPLAGL